ncbi:MAG: diadenylate cyclase CdaA [Lachnospiraceae bacterium]|nr:diadenylate cyclase CdaA [Lachnospiraceae bacterium]
MSFWENIVSYFHKYFSLTTITVIDVIEIIIIAILFYYLIIWFKKTRAWTLFKGIIMILIVVLLAAIFNFNTILWIASKTLSVGVIALIIIFQPELRRALEQLGRRSIFRGLFSGSSAKKELFSDKTLEETLEAVADLSRYRTGALICFEKEVGLDEYVHTGIELDSVVSSQLLENIFEDKTPLHDGAVIIRDDRIVAATCYLPMSNSTAINKKYGTRHRAGLGLSEVTDAFTIIVSEETGHISLAIGGELIEDVDFGELKNRLIEVQAASQKTGFLQKLRKGGKENGQN